MRGRILLKKRKSVETLTFKRRMDKLLGIRGESLKMPIAVLGGGNAAHMMAADLTLRGFDVNLCHIRESVRFKPTLEKGEIEVTGPIIQGTAKIHKVTMNMEEAISDVELIHLAISSLGHEAYFNKMMPHLKEGQLVVIWAGDAGSLRLAKLLREKAPEKRVLIAETNTIPYGTRVIGPAKCSLTLETPRIMLSAFPARDTEKAVDRVKEAFPMIRPAQNVLAISFSNPNPTVHPAGSLPNVGRIQYSKGDFYLYREGVTEAVARLIRAVYDETAAVAKAYDFKILEYEDEDFRSKGSVMAVEFKAPFDTMGVIADFKGPSSLYDRYITEDLPYGLVHRSQLGKKVGVPTPIIDAFINIGSVVCQTDFWKGRTLEDLGLAEKKREEIIRYVMEGT